MSTKKNLPERPEHWIFGTENSPILVSGAENLITHLSIFLNGWSFRHCEFNPRAKINIEISDGADGQIIIHQKVIINETSVFNSEFEAARALADILIATHAYLQDDVLYLRASANFFSHGIKVFLGPQGHTEHELALRLAARGCRLFSDDKIFLRLGSSGSVLGISPGNTPSVAIPLQDDPNAVFEDFVDSFTEIKNSERAFLKLWDSECAGFNEEAAVSAIVALERSSCDKSEFSDLTADLASELMMENCQSSNLGQERHRVTAKKIAKNIKIFKLRYNSFDEAARALLN